MELTTSLGKVHAFSRTTIILNLFALIGSFLFFTLQARLDPDSYHDGFLLASAIAVGEGKIPNQDFFAQYGPLTPLLQGAWIYFFGSTVFALRMLTAIQLSLISLILFHKLRSTFNSLVAIIITLCWVIGNPIDGLGSTIRPWPEVTTTLLLLISMILIESRLPTKISASIVGSVLSLISLNRINQVSIGLLFIVFLLFHHRKINRIWLVYTLKGYLMGVAAALAYLYLSGSLTSYVSQVINYGFISHIGNGNGLRPAVNIRILFFGALSYLLVSLLNRLKAQKSILTSLTIRIVFLLGAISYFIFCGMLRDPKQQFSGLSGSVQDNLILIALNSPNLGNYAFCFFSLVGLAYFRGQSTLSSSGISFLLAIASLSALYPTAAALKIWWVVPTVIFALPNISTFSSSWSDKIRHLTIYFLLPSIISLSIISIKHFSIIREPYTAILLKGTFGISPTREILDSNLALLNNALSTNNARFECMRGLYAVSSGRYQSIDKYYVTFIPPFKGEKEASKFIYYCDLQEEKLSKLKNDQSLVLLFEYKSEISGLKNALFTVSTTPEYP